MVKGLEKFGKYFEKYSLSYVLIGGAACDLWITDVSLRFRTTKDLDVVLILESLDREFALRINQFVREGKYKNFQKSTGKRQYFRFFDPLDDSYPSMIELFSRLPDGILFPEDREIVPIPVDEDLSSLSAILMDEDYYSLLINERRVVNNIPVISPAGLICLKMHAWLDLTKRKLNGEPVDFEDIRKHKNDVFRLFFAVAADDAIVIPLSIQKDVRDFLTAIEAEPWEIKNLGKTIGINMPPAAETIFQALYKTFGLQLQKY